MVAPVVIAAGIAAGAAIVGGVMQWYQAEKARGATNDRLHEIEAMFNSIVPPQYDLAVWDNPALAGHIPEPAFDFHAITPEQYKQVQTFNPELADFIAEKAPELPKVTAAATEGRAAQLSALGRYRQIAAGEADPELQQMLQEASAKANRDAQSRQASVMQDAARRGQLGSAQAIAGQLQAGGDAMARQAQQSQQAAAEGYRNRLRALDQSAALGGDIRSSEMGEQAKNAQIINDANQRAVQRYQAWLQGNADTRNAATQGNIATAQRISDANVANRNKYNVENQDRLNALQEKLYGYRSKEREAAVEREKYKNQLRQQTFGNAMDVARGKSGIAQTGIDYLRQDARDRNQAVQGVTDAVGAGAMMYGRYGRSAPDPAPEYSNNVGGVVGSSQGARIGSAAGGGTPGMAIGAGLGAYEGGAVGMGPPRRKRTADDYYFYDPKWDE